MGVAGGAGRGPPEGAPHRRVPSGLGRGPEGQGYCTGLAGGRHDPVTATLALGLACLSSASPANADPELRTGTIVIGVPRARFLVLGADRLWSNGLPRPNDPPWQRRGRQVKIAVHETLPLTVAAAGLATLGPERDTVEYIRELITPLDRASQTVRAVIPGYSGHKTMKSPVLRQNLVRLAQE